MEKNLRPSDWLYGYSISAVFHLATIGPPLFVLIPNMMFPWMLITPLFILCSLLAFVIANMFAIRRQ